MNGQPVGRPKVLFKDISRVNADKGLPNMLKYFVNYAFYKFGVEATFIMIVHVVDRRRNMISLVYLIMLLILFISTDRCKRKIWPVFRFMVFVMIGVQYLLAVGLPSAWCVSKYIKCQSPCF